MDCARAVAHHLRDVAIPVVNYHGGMPADLRAADLAAFMAGGSDEAGGTQQPVMVCTDVAARGLNFTGQADHVVNFDFPLTSIDYIHRSGRTARAGKLWMAVVGGAWGVHATLKSRCPYHASCLMTSNSVRPVLRTVFPDNFYRTGHVLRLDHVDLQTRFTRLYRTCRQVFHTVLRAMYFVLLV